jgi:Domain of unknown function (DUF4430)
LNRQLRAGHGAVVTVVIALIVAGAFSGCSDSKGSAGPSATLEVTRDFGRETVLSESDTELPSRPTVVRLLREHAKVQTELSGLSIKSIDGLRRAEATADDDDETTWALNVNGIEADVAPVDYKVYPGDIVQLDLRYWYVTLDVRATVGAFPETFSRGAFGKLFPVRVRCEKPSAWACRHVKQLLHRAGVPSDGTGRPESGLPPAGNPQRAEILVGRWDHWRSNEWAKRIDEGARYSGVFARFAPNARSLRLLDWYAHPVRSEGAGTGLVAAQRPTEEDLQWVVTGVDDEGVDRAARALGSPALRNAFAVAVTENGAQKVPLPPPPGSKGP